jgi:hypothetical protein
VLNNEPITLEKLKELAERIRPKTVFLNQKTYDSVMKIIDFEPTNLVINNYIPDNQAIVMNGKQLIEMEKGYFIHKLF